MSPSILRTWQTREGISHGQPRPLFEGFVKAAIEQAAGEAARRGAKEAAAAQP